MSTSPESANAVLKEYLTGYGLAIALTIIPFWLVWSHSLPASATLKVIGVCALLQLLVQMRCFLHLKLQGRMRQDTMIFLVTLLFVILMVGGSLWIMADLDVRMQ